MNHFFDIGANVGQTFDMLLLNDTSHDGWTVWCFEPSVRHLPALCAAIERHKHRYNIVLCPFGIGGENTTAKFYPKTDLMGDSFEENLYLAPTPIPNLTHGYGLVFPVVSLPEFILRHTASEDVIELKLDCEGGEFTALPALLTSPALNRVKSIRTEFHNNGTGWDTKMNQIKADYAAVGRLIQDWL